MFTVYSLYSKKYDKFFNGFTSNIEQRLKSHNELANKRFMVCYQPWELVYSEDFDNKKSAIIPEKELKSHQGREFLRIQIL
ncbi:MAG: GIY-YIG nuclease family protein [Candidatus Cloacimonadota bacterium]|nr:MAG: GIY-YIG nuclease family protein [Candidatus Cloacimonadota bacterium]